MLQVGIKFNVSDILARKTDGIKFYVSDILARKTDGIKYSAINLLPFSTGMKLTQREERRLWLLESMVLMKIFELNRLTPNDPYMGRTAPLTSKRCILYIYSTNIGTECFKHALYSPFFFSSKCSLFRNANLFDSCISHILYTGCAKIKKIIPAPKG